MFSVGIGTSGRIVGITIGKMPRSMYFARISATRASIGMQGYGKPSKGMKSIIAVRSTPVIVSFEYEEVTLGATSTFVMTPSMSVFGIPLIVATRITRMKGTMLAPPARRNIVSSGE